MNDVSEAVVEVAWAALNMQQEVELKGLLAVEILDNDKLLRFLRPPNVAVLCAYNCKIVEFSLVSKHDSG